MKFIVNKGLCYLIEAGKIYCYRDFEISFHYYNEIHWSFY